jgi:hypothetical protein
METGRTLKCMVKAATTFLMKTISIMESLTKVK